MEHSSRIHLVSRNGFTDNRERAGREDVSWCRVFLVLEDVVCCSRERPHGRGDPMIPFYSIDTEDRERTESVWCVGWNAMLC